MRLTLDRAGPLYHAIYTQRANTQRINSRSKELGVKRPKVRNLETIHNLNTLPLPGHQCTGGAAIRTLNTSLLSKPIRLVA
jgi:hypothetical protein